MENLFWNSALLLSGVHVSVTADNVVGAPIADLGARSCVVAGGNVVGLLVIHRLIFNLIVGWDLLIHVSVVADNVGRLGDRNARPHICPGILRGNNVRLTEQCASYESQGPQSTNVDVAVAGLDVSGTMSAGDMIPARHVASTGDMVPARHVVPTWDMVSDASVVPSRDIVSDANVLAPALVAPALVAPSVASIAAVPATEAPAKSSALEAPPARASVLPAASRAPIAIAEARAADLMLFVAFIVHLQFLSWNLCCPPLAFVVSVLDFPFAGLSPSRD